MRNTTKVFNFKWGKKKEEINVNLDWSILDKVKPYSPASKKCMLRLTEKYHIIFSSKNNLLDALCMGICERMFTLEKKFWDELQELHKNNTLEDMRNWLIKLMFIWKSG